MKASSMLRDSLSAAVLLQLLVAFAIPLRAAFTSGSFAPRVDVPAEGQGAMAFGDLDQDGRPECVVANYSASTISVYRNVGTVGAVNATSFAPPVNFPIGANPVQIRLADVDVDGRLDIVAANHGYSVSVLRNTSMVGVINSNSFAPTVNVMTPGQVPNVAIAELNGDGKPDLVVGCFNPGVFCLYQNNSTPGTISFGSLVDMNLGSGVSDVEAGDVDGDGAADLLIALADQGGCYVYRNLNVQGVLTRSSFAFLEWYIISRGATIALADVDGDAKPDLIVANANANTLSIRRNTATAGRLDANSFASAVTFPTGTHPFNPTAGDLNRDGRLDIVVPNHLSATLTVYQNLSIPGSLALAPPVDYPTGLRPRDCAVADVDVDGLPDLASANYDSPFFSIYRQLSPPAPPPLPRITMNPASIQAPVGGPASFTVAAVGTGLSYHWLFRGVAISDATSSTFSIQNTTPADEGAYAAIVSNDGGSVTSAVAILNVILPPAPQIITNPASQTVDLGDSPVFNVSAVGTNLSYQWYFQGVARIGATSATLVVRSATFAQAGGYHVAVGNLGGVAKSLVATLSVRFDSNSTYEAHVGVPGNSNAAWIEFSDLDGNGKPEAVVAANYIFNGSVAIHRNVSVPGRVDASSFAPPVNFGVGDQVIQATLADLDGDGKKDIVCVCQRSYGVWLLRNTTMPGIIDSSSFATPTTLGLPERPTWGAVVDLNGDGKQEVIVATRTGTRALYGFVNTSVPGNIMFGQATFLTPNADSASVETGDLDGDGKPDIVVCSLSLPEVFVFRNIHAGGGIFDGSLAPRVAFSAPANSAAKLADMDGDGKLDIVLVSETENTASVLRNTSTPGVIDTNSFAARIIFPTGRSPYRPGIGDLNRDGRPDLAISNTDDDTISVYLNTANPGSFTTASLAPRTDYPTGLAPRLVAMADIDRDGSIDLATANLLQPSFSVLRRARPCGTVLRQPALVAGGMFQFEFDGEPEGAYGIDASTNLLHWTTLTNILNPSGPFQFRDSGASGVVRRFYRVREQRP